MKKIIIPVLLSLLCATSYASDKKDSNNLSQLAKTKQDVLVRIKELNIGREKPISPFYDYSLTVEKVNKENPSKIILVSKYNGSGLADEFTSAEDLKEISYIKKCETLPNAVTKCTSDTIGSGFAYSIYAHSFAGLYMTVNVDFNKGELLNLKDITKNGMTIQLPEFRNIRIKNSFEYSNSEKKVIVFKSSNYESEPNIKDEYIFTLTLEPGNKN
jgi:hypothetical protein